MTHFPCRPLHKFGRFFLGIMAVKLVQKGQRGSASRMGRTRPPSVSRPRP